MRDLVKQISVCALPVSFFIMCAKYDPKLMKSTRTHKEYPSSVAHTYNIGTHVVIATSKVATCFQLTQTQGCKVMVCFAKTGHPFKP